MMVHREVASRFLLFAVELLENQVQEKVDVQLETTFAAGSTEQIHELMVVELCLEEVVERYRRAGAWDHETTHASFNMEHTNFI